MQYLQNVVALRFTRSERWFDSAQGQHLPSLGCTHLLARKSVTWHSLYVEALPTIDCHLVRDRTMKQVDQVDVAIAGGGPGGLAAAAAIVRALPDCRVKARPYSPPSSSYGTQHAVSRCIAGTKT